MDKSATVQILEDFAEIRRNLNMLALRDLRPLGLGQKQAMILRFISRKPQCSLAELSRATLSDPAAVTRAIDSLEKAEWVERKEHPTDRRRWVLSLTAIGKKKISSLEELAENISQCLVQSLNKNEIQVFARLLTKVKEPLVAMTEGQTVIEDDEG